METDAKILVTGGAGFIGSHLVSALVKKGFRVVVLDNFSTGCIQNLRETECKVISACLQDRANLRKALSGVDVVYHLAASVSVVTSNDIPDNIIDTNIRGVSILLEEMGNNGIGRLIFASSSAVYGEVSERSVDESHSTVPLSVYGASKLVGEEMIKSVGKLLGIDSTILRFFNVYGPRQKFGSVYSAVIPAFVESSRRDGFVNIFGSGKQTRDFVYVHDVVKALVHVLEKEIKGTYNVGTGFETSIEELADRIRAAVNPLAEFRFMESRRGEIVRSCASNGRLNALGWDASYDIASGISDYLKYYLGQVE